ncbi:SMP-30/gluconolactonase/LRE family protein [Amycolatopsis thermophila]|uniref:Gluconolactonase n=1 Tax=Amycolatopsis thermophila TaxID=206084 RepID=A0ABU0F245_9PSEU|nr:SMP-30/gluconolactonase/LRE family protein [Amycolatopsis thermophila]MDQ0381097.1 gluconolactonase [Amycolatopsis thermophila]
MTPAPVVVADGLRFPEGPSYLGGGALAVVEMKGEAVSRVAPDGTVTTLGDCGGGPNGSALGASGEVYVANNGGLSVAGNGYWHAPRQFDGRVQRVDPDGTVTTVGGELPGPAPHRPNDLCFGPDGTLYVTDSANWEDLRNIRPGRVVAIGPDGSRLGAVEVPAMPNGVAFGPDGRLHLTQSLTRKVLAFEVAGGTFGEPGAVAELPTGSPDGLCFDGDGTLYVCGSIGNAIFVYAGGELKETIETGEGTQPTNCCVGDDGRLYVTFSLSGHLVAFDLGLTPWTPHTGSITAREDS